MSQFLPEETQAPKASTVAFTPSVGDASGDVALMQRVLSAAVQNPSLIPPDFMAYVVDFIQTQRLIIPIGQVFGFRQQNDIRGRVGSTGAISNGVGFTVSKLGTGLYLIAYTTPLSATPAIGVTVDDNTSALACKVSNASTTVFEVNVYDMAGTLTDAGFYFTASPFT